MAEHKKKYKILCISDHIDPLIYSNSIKKRFKDIEAISISSQGVTFVPVDRDGKEMRKGIVFYDTRAGSEARALTEHFGEDKIYEITGQPAVSPQLEAAKLMWINGHEPDCYREMYKVLLVHDYIAYKFTGEFVCVSPVISSSLLFDVKQKKWWEEMLDFIGLSKEKLPDIYRPGEPIGPISKEVAAETGICGRRNRPGVRYARHRQHASGNTVREHRLGFSDPHGFG